MVSQIILAAATLGVLFLLFLVLSKAIGSIDNCLYKLEYLIRKECDLKLEGLEKRYKMRAADKKFDEMYSIRRIADDVAKEELAGEKSGDAKNPADDRNKASDKNKTDDKNKAAGGNG